MEKIIKLDSDHEAISLYGSLDQRLRFAEDKFRVRIAARQHRLKVSGAKRNVSEAIAFFKDELGKIRSGRETVVRSEAAPAEPKGREKSNGITFTHKGKLIRPKSKNQAAYLEDMQNYDVVVSIGPAGTGKTYLAVAMAIEALKTKQFARIILTRPAVEAGESLGFLPGDLFAKIHPYLRPLYDALYDMMEVEDVSRYIERGIIEIAPLAYMRGRTLSDSFIILDFCEELAASEVAVEAKLEKHLIGAF